ncbi:hypothetical protein OnM2_101016 [Erysiphe neolycopersici]|uniref:Uncharacterized protein n=1 Tax=Erysiphe neolycopersici TaxID=212602 RepID=A0A420H8T1_9PEZI|nr:hypothetical protein OnM2_101016 [Erysiphe neolycopersici]
MSSSASHSGSMSKAAIGGIVCGVCVAFLILGLIIFVLLYQRKIRMMKRTKEQNSIITQEFKANRSEEENEIQAPAPQTISPLNTTSQGIRSETLDSTQPVNNFDFNLFPNPPREYTIRQIPEEEESLNDTPLTLRTNNEQSSSLADCYKLPIISFSDKAFPIPTSLLSTQVTLESPNLIEEGEFQDQLSNLPQSNPIISPRPIQTHKRKASHFASQGEIFDIMSDMSGFNANLYPGFLMPSQTVPIEEKDRESPTLGVRNPVKISTDSSSAHRNSNGCYRSDSENSRNSVNSMDRHIISDEELERLGIGPRI